MKRFINSVINKYFKNISTSSEISILLRFTLSIDKRKVL